MSMEKDKKLEDILNSLDGVRRAEAPVFFYTRLKARMERELEPFLPVSKRRYPAFALAAVIAVMLINAFVLFSRNGNSAEPVASSESDALQSIAADNNINDVSGIFDLNDVR